MRLLGAIGPDAREAIPAILGQAPLRTGSDEESAALEALAGIGAAAVPHLLPLLKEKDRKARHFAIRALGRIGPAASAAGEELRSVMAADRNLRPAAAAALAAMGPEDRALVIETILGEDDPAIVQAIGEAGIEPGAALAILERVIRTPGTQVRDEAVTALGRVGKAAIPLLIDVIEDPELGERAIRTLADFEAAAAPGIPSLRAALRSKDPAKRIAAARALARMGPAARQADSALAAALDDPDSSVRAQALYALDAIRLGRW
jgi:HEAT repeat protein